MYANSSGTGPKPFAHPVSSCAFCWKSKYAVYASSGTLLNRSVMFPALSSYTGATSSGRRTLLTLASATRPSSCITLLCASTSHCVSIRPSVGRYSG